MAGLTASEQAPRDGRRQRWYVRRSGGTSGNSTGTRGKTFRGLVPGYLAAAIFMFLICGVNVLSNLDEASRADRVLAPWIPICKEFSSWIGLMVACSLARAALSAAPPGRTGWPRLVSIHLIGSLAFSGVHQTVMTWLRIVIFVEHGQIYRRPPLPADLLYEYRKDLLAYLIISSLFWLFKAPEVGAPAPSAESKTEEALPIQTEPTFDIIDGAKILRVPVRRIVAVKAVRNYVEFLIEDGETPLMRASLGAVEAALRSHGLIRTHRSWLVNPDHLRSLETTGSGDFRLALNGGIQVPLSRRYPEALGRLRNGPQEEGRSII